MRLPTRLIQVAGRNCIPLRRSVLSARSRTYATAAPEQDIYDVVIVGGGPAGLLLASSLRASPVTNHLRIALVEGMPLRPVRNWQAPPGTFSNRVVSLTPSSVQFFTDIGVWAHIERDRVQPYRSMQVWDGVSGSKISFLADLLQRDSLAIAYICENLNLVSSLLARLDELGGTEILDGTRVERIRYGEDTPDVDLRTWPVVEVSGGRKLAARLLVGADGVSSPVRKFAEIETRGWDYERHGVVATLRLDPEGVEREGEKTAYQRFLPSGPIAMLPLPGQFASLVWSTTPQHTAILKSLSGPDFCAMVNAGFRLSHVDLGYMGKLRQGVADEFSWREPATPINAELVPPKVVDVQEKSVASFPLKFRHADTYISDRIALVGDAAHSIHPMAGQGLNQGAGDVRSLASTLERAVENGQDVGAQLSLEPYWSDRYLKNHVMLGVVDKLHLLYGTSWPPVVATRSLGLGIVDRLDVLKSFFMAQAAGR